MILPEIELQNANIWKSPTAVEMKCEFSRPRFVTRYELECYIGDGGETCIDGECHALLSDSVSFSRPGQIRKSHFPFKTRFIYFDVPTPHVQFLRLLTKIPMFTAPDSETACLFDRLIDAYDRNDSLSMMKAQAILIEILFRLSDNCQTETHIRNSQIIGQTEMFNSIRYMKENINRHLTVAEMAAAAGYSIPHFNARFKELARCAPYEYFMSLKVREAQRLLLSSDNSVTVIAQQLEFASTSHFCSLFRRLVGKTPIDFKKADYFSDYEIN
jgi:AraC-like DNA-binding protein